MVNQNIILLLLISFIGLGLGALVLYKNPKSRTSSSFFFLSLFSVLWINSLYFEDEKFAPDIMNFLLKLDFSFGAFFSLFSLLFCLDVAKLNIATKKYFRYLLILIPLIFTFLIFFTPLILSGYEILDNGVINPVFGSGEIFYSVIVGLAPIFGVSILIYKFIKAKDEKERSKFIYLFLGLFLSLGTAVTTNIFLVDLIKDSPDYSLYSRLGAFSLIFFIIFGGYAILKHRAIDIRVIGAEIISFFLIVISFFQIFLSNTTTEIIVSIAIFVVLLIMLFMLIRSVNNEVKRKEELQVMADKLARANQELKKLDNAKTEFVSIASHQLRTPITAIKGYLSLILEDTYGELNPKMRDIVGKAYHSTERLVELIEDLLNVSRMESGRMQFEFEYADPKEIIDEVHDSLILRAKEKKLYLEKKTDSKKLPKIRMDASKIREVVSNLVDNAIKYTDKGGVTINAEMVNGNSNLRIIVSDTGIGIPESEMDSLFKKFSRGRDTSRLHVGGTGLGLFVGKGIVERHGGKIWAESKGNKRGSKFIIELPLESPKK